MWDTIINNWRDIVWWIYSASLILAAISMTQDSLEELKHDWKDRGEYSRQLTWGIVIGRTLLTACPVVNTWIGVVWISNFLDTPVVPRRGK